MKIFEVSEEFAEQYREHDTLHAQLDDLLARNGGEVTSEAEAIEAQIESIQEALLSKQADYTEAVHSYVNRIAYYEALDSSERAYAERAQEEVERYSKRAERAGKRAQWLRQTLLHVTDTLHDGEIKTHRFLIKGRNYGKGSVQIIDESLLPDSVKVIVTTEKEVIKKDIIREAFKKGMDVPGAVLTDPVRKLVIK